MSAPRVRFVLVRIDWLETWTARRIRAEIARVCGRLA
jgi:hypothetical protein